MSPRTVFQPKHEASTEVLTLLRRIIHAIDVQSRRLSKETGLSAPQLIILQAIQSQGEVTTKQIASHVSLSQATVTTILDRLEKHGLVERYRSTTDRRIVHSQLTEAGAEMLESAPPLLQETFIEAFAALSAKKRADIISSLASVARMMGADDIDASPVLTLRPPKAEC